MLKDGAKPAASLTVGLTPPAGTELAVNFVTEAKWQGILTPKTRLDVSTVIKAAPADATWILTTKSGDLAKHVDDLLLVCEYAITDES